MSLRCPHCGKVDWSRAPALQETMDMVKEHGRMTSVDLAERLDLSVQAASNRLARLEVLDALRIEAYWSVRGGGRMAVYVPAARSRDTRRGVDPDPEPASPNDVNDDRRSRGGEKTSAPER